MNLDNHIAKRFLTDDSLKMEIIELMYPQADDAFSDKPIETRVDVVAGYPVLIEKESLKERIASTYLMLDTPKGHRPYYCTETMLSCLELMKIKKEGPHFNWTYFDKLTNQAATFIFPDNKLLRMHVVNETMSFAYIEYTPEDKVHGNMNSVMFYLNRKTGVLCEHFEHKDVKKIEEFIYRLLCFVYMADIEEVIIPAGTKHGTRKSGKLINTSPFPITIINSKWNITSIRNEEFWVSPHWSLRHTGPGGTIPRYVFIDWFKKDGYVRRAKPEGFALVKENTND